MCSLVFQRKVSDWRGWALAWRGLQADCLGILIPLSLKMWLMKKRWPLTSGEVRGKQLGGPMEWSKRCRNGRRAQRRVMVEISDQRRCCAIAFLILMVWDYGKCRACVCVMPGVSSWPRSPRPPRLQHTVAPTSVGADEMPFSLEGCLGPWDGGRTPSTSVYLAFMWTPG